MGSEETRRKWNRRYSEAVSESFLPEPNPLAAGLRHRFLGGRMLDAACGLGRGIATAGDAFEVIYAVDLSDVGVGLARRRWGGDGRIRWIVGDVTRMNWPGDFFGLVCAFGFTDHPFFSRLRGLIAPGGMMLYEGFSRRQLEVKPTLDRAWTTTPAEIAALFSGWETLVCEETAAPPFRVRFAAVRPGKINTR